MIKERKYTLTADLLNGLKQNAIKNATSLLQEAKILLSQRMWARAYFLACVSIEESGKAFIAFNSVNRNLSDPAVQHVLKMELENHGTKSIMGLSSLMRQGGTDPKHIDYFLQLNLHLYAGREKSLYVDINDDTTLTLPETLVRPEAASDSVRLSEHSLAATIEYIANNPPKTFSAHDDKSYTISKKSGVRKMMDTTDFWDFYVDVMTSMQNNLEDSLSVAISRYWDEYYSKGKCWGGVQSLPEGH